MESITRLANVVVQTSGGNYASWTDLNNTLHYSNYAYCSYGASTSQNHTPAPLTFTKFNCNIPQNADITRIEVMVSHRGVGGTPTIELVGVNGYSGRVSAPLPIFSAESSIKWDVSNVTPSMVNSDSFGVKISYPKNTTSNNGTIYLSMVRIIIIYTVPEYDLTLKRATGKYNQQTYELEASISNLNLTAYNPTLTLTTPAGFEFQKGTGTGTFTPTSNNTISWNPQLNRNIASSTCRFVFTPNVTFPDEDTNYTGTFTLIVNIDGTTKSYVATIYHRPPDESTDTSTYTPQITDNMVQTLQDITATVGEEIPNLTTNTWERCFCFPINGANELQFNATNTPVKYYDSGTWTNGTTYSNSNYYCAITDYENFKFTAPGRYALIAYDKIGDSTKYSDYSNAVPTSKAYVNIKPTQQSLTTPNFTILEPTQEEINRLGDGYTYIAQTSLKHTTTDTYPRDWYTNNRIGVYNAETNGTPTHTEIYEGTTNWSHAVTTTNTYDNLECEFTYNKNNPLYLVITGDYPETTTTGFDKGTVSFTEPCIIEKTVYTGGEPTGTYPVPILALIGEDETNANLTLQGYQNSTNIRLYNIPLESNNNNLAIRGIQVTGTIESTDNLTVYAKLYSPNGSIGQRSIIVSSGAQDFTLGSLGDLWGFGTLTLDTLEGWEIDLSVSNLLSNTQSTIQFKDVQIIFYLEEIERQDITVKVEGEDLAYYGAFIETITLPEGLETDTAFLTIDGTDTNDAYRQNIREKTITIGFNISECDLKTSTDMLRQLTKLLVNEKDQYNRPIPKRLEISYYPNDYFEYILEHALEISNEVTGYNVTAKLTVPAGTSYSKEDSITNTVGYVQGLAAVNPLITLQPSNENIQINETLSGQKFNIGYTGDWNDKIVAINCEDRQVLLVSPNDDSAPIDISQYVDHNVDWFRLYGEYNFEGVNCIIRTVSYNERW